MKAVVCRAWRWLKCVTLHRGYWWLEPHWSHHYDGECRKCGRTWDVWE